MQPWYLEPRSFSRLRRETALRCKIEEESEGKDPNQLRQITVHGIGAGPDFGFEKRHLFQSRSAALRAPKGDGPYDRNCTSLEFPKISTRQQSQ